MDEPVLPDRIIEVGMRFAEAKALLSAVELGLFTELDDGPLEREALETRLGLHPRATKDFLDTLVAMGFLDRQNGRYRNTPAAGRYLSERSDLYLGETLSMINQDLYPVWDGLTDALRTGNRQSNEGEDYFAEVYSDHERLQRYTRAMEGFSAGVPEVLADDINWDQFGSLCDLGAGRGYVPITIATEYDHISATAFDLPALESVATEYIESYGLADRVSFHAGDFFEDELPTHDVFVLGHILHDWGVDKRKQLLEKVYDALPPSGAVLIYGRMIDPERRENRMSLLMSLNMLVRTPEGSNYTTTACQTWLTDVGFTDIEIRELPGPKSMIIGRKSA